MACQPVKQAEPVEEEVHSEWIDSLQHVYQYGICIDSLDLSEYTLKQGDNPAMVFKRLGFTPLMADSMSRAAADVLDPTKLRAGMNYYVFSTIDSLASIQYLAFAKNEVDYAVIDLTGDTIHAYEFNKPVTLKRKYVEGTLNTSLWNTIRAQGADPLGHQDLGCICLANRFLRYQGG